MPYNEFIALFAKIAAKLLPLRKHRHDNDNLFTNFIPINLTIYVSYQNTFPYFLTTQQEILKALRNPNKLYLYQP